MRSGAEYAAEAISRSLTMTIINPFAFTFAAEAAAALYIQTTMRAAHTLATALIAETGSADWDQAALKQAILSLADSLIGIWQYSNLDKYFSFYLSPTTLDKTFTKIRDNKLTGAGPMQGTYGAQLIPFSYSGVVGNLMPPAIPYLNIQMRSPQLSPAYFYFAMFEEFFARQDNDLIFLLNGEASVGRLDSFKYGLDANNPWNIKYSFSASIYPNGTFGVLNGSVWDAWALIQPMKEKKFSSNENPFGQQGIDMFEEVYGTGRLSGELL